MLNLNNLSTFYGNFEAIKGISLSVDDGELVAIIGANGAGKTTLMRTVCGLHKPKKGQILFDDHDITFLSTVQRVKAGILYCPEGRMLFPDMTVIENLEMGAYTCFQNVHENLKKVISLFPILEERKKQISSSRNLKNTIYEIVKNRSIKLSRHKMKSDSLY